MSDYKLAIKIAGELDSSLQSAVNQAQRYLDGLNSGGKGGGAGKTVFNGLINGAKVAAKASLTSLGLIGAGTTALGKSAIDVGSNFESAMAALASTAGVDKASEQYGMLEEAARHVGATTNKTSTEAANALQYMALAGWGTVDSVDALEDMVKLSSATNTDLATTSDLVTDSMGALGLGMQDYAGYMDLVAKADSAANYTGTEFMETMIGAGGAARQLGVPLNDLGTAAGILANNGTKGAEAGTALNSMFMRLAGNDTAIKTMQDLGVTMYDANDQFVGMENVLQQVNTAMAGMDASTANQTMKDLFGTHYASEAKYLLDSIGEGGAWESLSQGLEQAQQGVDEFGNSFDTLDQKYKTMTDTLQGDLDILKSAFSSLGEDMYKGMVGGVGAGLRGMVQEATAYVNQLKGAFNQGGMNGLAIEVGNVIADISGKIANEGAQALQAATEFATSLIDSLGSTENSEKIGGAAATIITGLSTGFLNYTDNFVIAAGNIIQGIVNALNTEDFGAQFGDAASEMITNIGDYFAENADSFGTAAGNLISGIVEGLASHSGDLLVGGIEIVQGIAEGVVNAAVILASNAPQIVADLLNGILEAIPRFFQAGVAIISAVIDGIWSLGESVGTALYDALTMVDEAPDMGEIFDSATLDAYGQSMDAVNEKMVELVKNEETMGNYNLTGTQSDLIEGYTTLEEVMSSMSEMDPSSVEYMQMAQDVQGYMKIMQDAMTELGIEYQQTEAEVEESTTGISEATQTAMDAASEGIESGTSETKAAMEAGFEELKASAETTGTEIEEALDLNLADSMGADALGTLLDTAAAGTIMQSVEQINAAMSSIQTSVGTAMLAVSASFAAASVAIGVSNAAVLLSCTVTAAGITAAFSSIDLGSIANNMMAGLTNGIIAGGQQALAAARSIASQIAAVMASALQVHSPSRVTYEIGSFVGAGLENALYDSQPAVASASQALANTVTGGTSDTLSSPLQTFNQMASEPSAGAQGGQEGGAGGGIVFSPQITIAGNASQADVQNALQWSMTEFEKMYDRLMKDRRRTAFA